MIDPIRDGYNLHEGARRVVSDLRELARLTSNERGAQRVAWSPTWRQAREWFTQKASETGAKVEKDAAGNLWACIPGESPDTLVIGSHLDCVPDGGWLDGCLGVMTALEALRCYSEGKKPRMTICAVDWADEEGARFGRSLLGSSAACGTLNTHEVAHRRDNEGVDLETALRENGVDITRMLEAHHALEKRHIKAYLELHIEQGPVLEKQRRDVACVTGITGVERHYITFRGQAAHAGSFPVPDRQDAFLAAAQASLAFRQIALKHKAVCTVGKVHVKPDVVTIVPGECTISLDQRAIDAKTLSIMYHEAMEMASLAARENGVTVEWEKLWTIPPTTFDPQLITLCKEAVQEETGWATTMHSGPLHDAAEIARLAPSVMMFAMSERGLSHCREENTPEAPLASSVRAFLRLIHKLAG